MLMTDYQEEPVLCWRCREKKTRKRVDGVPVCAECFKTDAAKNKNKAQDYSGLKDPALFRKPAKSNQAKSPKQSQSTSKKSNKA